MADFQDLLRAVVRNPNEDTPVAMLADHLIDGGDGRAEILRRWLSQPENRLGGRDWYGREQLGDGNSGQLDLGDEQRFEEGGVGAAMSAGPDHVKWNLSAQLPRSEMTPADNWTVPYRSFYIKATPVEARQIADALPNAAEVHKFLDTHFGPDPRFTQQLSDALKPKPE